MRWRENSGVARGGRCARWTRGCDAETHEDDLGRGHGRARLMTHPLFSFERRLLMPTTTARGAASAVSIRSSRNTCACSFALVERSRSRRERREDDAISSESRYRRVDKVDKGGGRAGAGRARRAGAERDGTPKRGREGCGEGIRPIGARVEGEPTAMRRERDARGARARAVFKKSAKRLTTDYALLLFFTTRSFRRCPQGHFGASRCASRGLDATRCDCARDATRRRAADARHRRRFGELDVFVERRCAHEVRLRAWR